MKNLIRYATLFAAAFAVGQSFKLAIFLDVARTLDPIPLKRAIERAAAPR